MFFILNGDLSNTSWESTYKLYRAKHKGRIENFKTLIEKSDVHFDKLISFVFRHKIDLRQVCNNSFS